MFYVVIATTSFAMGIDSPDIHELFIGLFQNIQNNMPNKPVVLAGMERQQKQCIQEEWENIQIKE